MGTSSLDIRPVTGRIGAEIAGVDLTTDLDDAIVTQIRETLLRWKVVFFRDQRLDPDTQLAFARRFGPVTTAHPTVPGLEEHPDVLDVDAQGGNIARQWHTDLFQGHVERHENLVRWRWRLGDVAFWDNRTTQHRAIADFGDSPRRLHRVTIAGDLPYGVSGRPSQPLSGDSARYTPAAA